MEPNIEMNCEAGAKKVTMPILQGMPVVFQCRVTRVSDTPHAFGRSVV